MSNVIQFKAKVVTAPEPAPERDPRHAEWVEQARSKHFFLDCLMTAALIAGVIHWDFEAADLLYAEVRRRMQAKQNYLRKVPPELAERCAQYLVGYSNNRTKVWEAIHGYPDQ